jgi:hypothetical protein
MASGAATTLVPAPGDDLARSFQTLLRRRAHGLARHFDPPVAQAARLFPILLHTSYHKTSLDLDPPGVTGLRYRQGWVRRAALFGLPPPSRVQRDACLAEAVFVFPGASGPELVVLVSPDSGSRDRDRLEARTEHACAVLRKGGVALTARVLEASEFCTPTFAARAFLFGALLAGQPGPETWEGLLRAWEAPPSQGELAQLFAVSPSTLSSLAVGILAGGSVPPAAAAMALFLARGVTAASLAAPDAASVAWAGMASGLAAELGAVRGLLHPVKTAGWGRARGLVRPAPIHPELSELLRIGGLLSLAFLRSVRRSPPLRASPLWRAVLAAGIPRSLLHSIGEGMSASPAARSLEPGLQPVDGPRGFEVLVGTDLLARGATQVQARVRALALVAAAGGERQLAGVEPQWKALAARLGRVRTQPALLLVVGEATGTEAPLDPLNRGPLRQVGFASALVIRLGPGRRPATHLLAPEVAVETFIRAVRAGHEVEVLPFSPGATSVAVRLGELAKLLGAPGKVGAPASPEMAPRPIAVQVGGKVLLLEGDRLRTFPLARFLARPRTFVADPEAPDLSASPGDPGGSRGRLPGLLQVRATLASPGHAWVLYSDGVGRFRQQVALAELEEHLRDARTALHEAQLTAALAIRSDAEVEAALRRAGAAPPARRLEIQVRGQLPHGLQVRVGRPVQQPAPDSPDSPDSEDSEDWYGGSQAAGWESAALAAMACWVPGEEGRIACQRVQVTTPPGCSAELATLYARAVATRRLNSHLHRLLLPYRMDERSRRVG